ncbi:Hypothetical protein CINCED_3A003670 [Cinara cedri]|uniref:Uncharacterized protein n=1 Tax=Cinara cedri TaxID=506608 RepID=A0A5E4N5I2_9HEMI|nr:Hypothetical protein CINCED_3A003670 [Cinara cedri]
MAAIGCLMAVSCLKTRVKKRKRKIWVKDWLSKRAKYLHVNLLTELRICPKDWQNYLRIDEDTYLKLLALITPFIKKNDTVMRQAISPHERLTTILRFLATGRSYADLKFSRLAFKQFNEFINKFTAHFKWLGTHESRRGNDKL